MEKAFVALGANLGNAQKALRDVIVRINAEEGISVTRTSSEALLHALLDIENEFGRVRPVGVHNAPRLMDLDLLLYGDQICKSKFLTLPHPRMHERAFVLVPLCEISPEVEIPEKGKAKSFLPRLKDQGIEKIQ